jgi:hypothetical protein
MTNLSPMELYILLANVMHIPVDLLFPMTVDPPSEIDDDSIATLLKWSKLDIEERVERVFATQKGPVSPDLALLIDLIPILPDPLLKKAAGLAIHTRTPEDPLLQALLLEAVAARFTSKGYEALLRDALTYNPSLVLHLSETSLLKASGAVRTITETQDQINAFVVLVSPAKWRKKPEKPIETEQFLFSWLSFPLVERYAPFLWAICLRLLAMTPRPSHRSIPSCP